MKTNEHTVSIPGGDAEKRSPLRFCPGKHTGDRNYLTRDENRFSGDEFFFLEK
jgi:hypothetical protein